MQIFSDIPPQMIPRSSVSLLVFSTNDIYAFFWAAQNKTESDQM